MTVNIRALTRIKSQTLMGTSLASPVINWDFIQAQSLTSFSRGSLATMFDSTGKLTYAPNNIALYSEQFNQTGTWTTSGTNPNVDANATTAPDGTTTADKFKERAATAYQNIFQSISQSAGTHIFSIYVKKAESDRFVMFAGNPQALLWVDMTTSPWSVFDSTNVVASSLVNVGNGWYRVSLVYTNSSAGSYNQGFNLVDIGTTNTINYLGNTTDGAYLWGAQLEAVTYQTTPSTYNATTSTAYYGPRYPYAYNGSTWDAQGLLVEAAGTNLATYSEAFNIAAWTPNNLAGTPSADVAVSPSGVQNADKIIPANGSNASPMVYYLGTTTSETRTLSCYVKAAGYNRAFIRIGGGTPAPIVVFLLSGSGSVEASQNQIAAGISEIGNGWYRIWVTYANSSSAYAPNIGATSATYTLSSTEITVTGNGTDGIFAWGFQQETGLLPTSYIPNLATGTKTRNADTSLAFSAINRPTGLSFSRTSNAMQYDAAGRLTYAPNNILTQSNTFSAWTTEGASVSTGVADPFGGNNASTVTAVSGSMRIYIPITGGSSKGYTAVWMRRRTGTGAVQIGGYNGNYVTPSPAITSSWQLVSTPVVDGPPGYGFVVLSTVGDAVDVYSMNMSQVTYETVPRPCDQVITTTTAYYGPRYDYDPTTRLPKGLLVEEARTNVLPYSGTLSNAIWSVNGVTKGSSVTAPDGTASATTITETATTAEHSWYNPVTVSSNTTFSASIYLKNNGRRYVILRPLSDAQSTWWGAGVFDLQSGVVTQTSKGSSVSTVSASIQDVGNGWYRCVVSIALSSGQTSMQLALGLSDTGTPTIGGYGVYSYTGGGTLGVFAWGGQLEVGASFPTSYIPTTSASVPRSADVATLTGVPLATLGNTDGSVFVEIGKMPTYVANPRILETNTQVPMYVVDNTRWDAYGASGSIFGASDWVTIGSGNSFTGNTVRLGLSWSGLGSSGVANAGAVYSSASNIFSGAAPSSAYIGSATDGTKFMNTHLRKLAIYNVRMADAKLKEKSVVGASF